MVVGLTDLYLVKTKNRLDLVVFRYNEPDTISTRVRFVKTGRRKSVSWGLRGRFGVSLKFRQLEDRLEFLSWFGLNFLFLVDVLLLQWTVRSKHKF